MFSESVHDASDVLMAIAANDPNRHSRDSPKTGSKRKQICLPKMLAETTPLCCCEWSRLWVLSGTRFQKLTWPTSKQGVGKVLAALKLSKRKPVPKVGHQYPMIRRRQRCLSPVTALHSRSLGTRFARQRAVKFKSKFPDEQFRGVDFVRASSSERTLGNPFPARCLQLLCFSGQGSFNVLQTVMGRSWDQDLSNDPQKRPVLPKRRGMFNIFQSAATIMVHIISVQASLG